MKFINKGKEVPLTLGFFLFFFFRAGKLSAIGEQRERKKKRPNQMLLYFSPYSPNSLPKWCDGIISLRSTVTAYIVKNGTLPFSCSNALTNKQYTTLGCVLSSFSHSLSLFQLCQSSQVESGPRCIRLGSLFFFFFLSFYFLIQRGRKMMFLLFYYYKVLLD